MINTAAMLGLGNQQARKDLKGINTSLNKLIKLKYADTQDEKKYRKEQKEFEKRDRQDNKILGERYDDYTNVFKDVREDTNPRKNWLMALLQGAMLMGGAALLGGLGDGGFFDQVNQKVEQALGDPSEYNGGDNTDGSDSGDGGVRQLEPVEANVKSKEQDLFQRLVLAEAKSEGQTGMALVARSVMNRAGLIQKNIVKPSEFNAKDGSIRGVIMGKNQYQPVRDGSINRKYTKAQKDAAAQAIALAQDINKLRGQLKNSGMSDKDVTNLMAATGFRTGYAFNDPSQNVNVTKYKNHYFNTAGNKGRKVPNAKMDSPVITGKVSGTVSNPSKVTLPPLPPTNTLPGGVQNYGASRDGGKRKHAGQDYDAPPNGKFYSRIGGEVIFSGNVGGGYGNVVDIYNRNLNVTERIAEGSKRHVKKGQKVSAGQVVQSGTHQTGVFHYEIRDGRAGHSGSFAGTRDPKSFLQSETTKKGRIIYQKKQDGGFVDTYTGDRELYMGTKVMPDSKQINTTGKGYNMGGLIPSPELQTSPILPAKSYQAGGLVGSPESTPFAKQAAMYDQAFYSRKSQPVGHVVVMETGGGGSQLPMPAPSSTPRGPTSGGQANFYDIAKLYSSYCRGIKI